MKKLVWFLLSAGLVIGGLFLTTTEKQVQPPAPPAQNTPTDLPRARKPQISVKVPSYLAYDELVAQLDKWHSEAPDYTERGSYGKSTKGKLLQYLRVTNLKKTENKKVVLITACIHGNEPLSCGTVMAYIGSILSDTPDLLDSRDIYFIPVVSPDSYPNARYVDGVDPNRNFPTKNGNEVSVPPIQALREFVLKIRPNAVISAHTWGRAVLVPWGDSMQNCPDFDAYKKVAGKMCDMAGYRFMRACDMYGVNGLNNPPPRGVLMPIYGTEVDWHYRQKSFAVVMEMGTHQNIPKLNEIQMELDKTYKAVLYFIQEAPIVELK